MAKVTVRIEECEAAVNTLGAQIEALKTEQTRLTNICAQVEQTWDGVAAQEYLRRLRLHEKPLADAITMLTEIRNYAAGRVEDMRQTDQMAKVFERGISAVKPKIASYLTVTTRPLINMTAPGRSDGTSSAKTTTKTSTTGKTSTTAKTGTAKSSGSQSAGSAVSSAAAAAAAAAAKAAAQAKAKAEAEARAKAEADAAAKKAAEAAARLAASLVSKKKK